MHFAYVRGMDTEQGSSMQTRNQTRELERIAQLWTAANDAKAEQIHELEHVVRIWSAANQAKAAKIEELELENEVLSGELAALRRQLAALQRSAAPDLARAA